MLPITTAATATPLTNPTIATLLLMMMIDSVWLTHVLCDTICGLDMAAATPCKRSSISTGTTAVVCRDLVAAARQRLLLWKCRHAQAVGGERADLCGCSSDDRVVRTARIMLSHQLMHTRKRMVRTASGNHPHLAPSAAAAVHSIFLHEDMVVEAIRHFPEAILPDVTSEVLHVAKQ